MAVYSTTLPVFDKGGSAGDVGNVENVGSEKEQIFYWEEGRERERICEKDEETIICSRTLKGCRWIVTDLGRARFAEQAGRPHGGRCPGPECKPSTAISLHPSLRCERHIAPASHFSLRERLLGFETLYHAQPSDSSCSFLQTTLLRTPGVADAALWAQIAEREWRADRLLHQCPSGRGR